VETRLANISITPLDFHDQITNLNRSDTILLADVDIEKNNIEIKS
jgi:hypothetical protein